MMIMGDARQARLAPSGNLFLSRGSAAGIN
jgi:hypothetical protein